MSKKDKKQKRQGFEEMKETGTEKTLSQRKIDVFGQQRYQDKLTTSKQYYFQS